MAQKNNQKNVAGLFWARILTREEKLPVAQDLRVGIDMMNIFAMENSPSSEFNRELILAFINKVDQCFGRDDSCDVDCMCIKLDYSPIGLPADAAKDAGSSFDEFPAGKLTMTFGSPEDDNLILTSENNASYRRVINASEYVEENARKAYETLDNGSNGESKSHSM